MKRRSFLAMLGLAPVATVATVAAKAEAGRDYDWTEIRKSVVATPDHPEFAAYQRYSGYDELNYGPDELRAAELAAKAADVVTGHNDLLARMKATGRIV